MIPYRVRRAPRRETLRVRGLDLNLHRWGPEESGAEPPWVLLHGWLNTGDTFQFMVDAFARDHCVVAPDWRGFGHSAWSKDAYWFPDYFADLEALLDLLAPRAPACLIGHSMGGNIASMYAGLRPERVRCVANLEGVGLPRSAPDRAPGTLRKWLDQVKSIPLLKDYDSVEQLATVIRFRYPRFTPAQAGFVAAAWSKPENGRVRLLGDPRHRWTNPVRYRREDAEACWRAATAPQLMLLGDESEFLQSLGADGSDEALRAALPNIEIVHVAGAGHMLHIERADLVGPLVEDFVSAH